MGLEGRRCQGAEVEVEVEAVKVEVLVEAEVVLVEAEVGGAGAKGVEALVEAKNCHNLALNRSYYRDHVAMLHV